MRHHVLHELIDRLMEKDSITVDELLSVKEALEKDMFTQKSKEKNSQGTETLHELLKIDIENLNDSQFLGHMDKIYSWEIIPKHSDSLRKIYKKCPMTAATLWYLLSGFHELWRKS